jgi:hypothetical protein
VTTEADIDFSSLPQVTAPSAGLCAVEPLELDPLLRIVDGIDVAFGTPAPSCSLSSCVTTVTENRTPYVHSLVVDPGTRPRSRSLIRYKSP